MEGLNERQKKFCREYIYDFNGTRSYMAAYPDSSYDSAGVNATRLLGNDRIQAYIKELQADIEKQANISRLMVLEEHKKMAFATIAHLHNTWVERKEFDQLTQEQKACIAEITTQVRKLKIKGEDDVHEEDVEVEFVKIKLYDKQKSLDAISKMLGYNEPEKVAHIGDGLVPIDIKKASDGNK